MTIQIVLIVIVAVLLAYIIYLQTKLARNNIFIESTLKRIAGIKRKLTSEEIIMFLKDAREVNRKLPKFTDRLFDERPLDFLLGNHKKTRIYIHYTKFETDARNIIREGFLFIDTFYKTALPVTDDRLDLLIKHNGKKTYGDFLIILCFSDMLFERYASEIDKRGLKEVSVENILTETPPYRNENADIVYKIPNKFVKGYINHQTGEVVENPDFNPAYDSAAFYDNLKKLQENNTKLQRL
jgi:hypothetical protein